MCNIKHEKEDAITKHYRNYALILLIFRYTGLAICCHYFQKELDSIMGYLSLNKQFPAGGLT